VTGDLRLHTITSRVFGNTRPLRVLVPSGYDATGNRNRRYPVLFLNDGQNLFDAATAALNPMEWGVDEVVVRLIRERRIQPMIIVGIDSAGRRGRFKEYFPWVDVLLQPPEPNPQGSRYPEFLVDEVVPFVKKHYRVSSDVRQVGIGGSSAGALAAIMAVLHRPDVFGRLLAESPSLYLDDYHILREPRGNLAAWPGRVFLGVGTNESNAPACDPTASRRGGLANDQQRFADALRSWGVAEKAIRLRVVPCAQHDEHAWGLRLPEALEFLFGGR